MASDMRCDGHDRPSDCLLHWCRSTWDCVHIFAALHSDAPTDRDKALLIKQITMPGEIHPCLKCARHYSIYLKRQDLDWDMVVKNHHTAFYFTYYVHNLISEDIGNVVYSFAEASKVYVEKLEIGLLDSRPEVVKLKAHLDELYPPDRKDIMVIISGVRLKTSPRKIRRGSITGGALGDLIARKVLTS